MISSGSAAKRLQEQKQATRTRIKTTDDVFLKTLINPQNQNSYKIIYQLIHNSNDNYLFLIRQNINYTELDIEQK